MNELEEEFGYVYGEIINNIVSDLLDNNKKYKKNIDYCVEIIDKYPNLRLVCEDKVAVALSVEEVKALIEYLNCYENREIMEGKKLLYTGGKYAYVLLKNADLLNDCKLDEI